jgi:hypothetical protein
MVWSAPVTEAVRRNPTTCRATDSDVADVIKQWLKHASDREGGRTRRTRRLTVNSVDQS